MLGNVQEMWQRNAGICHQNKWLEPLKTHFSHQKNVLVLDIMFTITGQMARFEIKMHLFIFLGVLQLDIIIFVIMHLIKNLCKIYIICRILTWKYVNGPFQSIV